MTESVSGADNVLQAVTAVPGGGEGWAGGYEETSGAGQQLLESYWTSKNRWRVFPSPSVPSDTWPAVEDLSAQGPNDVWAAGSTTTNGVKKGFVEHYDGTSWTVAPFVGSAQLHGIAMGAPGDVWAVGDRYANGVHQGAQLEHYDGTSWSRFPEVPLHAGDTLHDVVSSGGAFWAVGERDTGTASGTRPIVMQLCPVRVTDSGFTSASTIARLGSPVEFLVRIADAESHDLTDGTGLGLFDSGSKSPGTSYVLRANWAGVYTVTDTADAATYTVHADMGSTPASGSSTDTFTLRWATAAAPSGDVFDVQIERPGDSSFSDWKTGVTERNDTFTPDAGAGDYQFRARLRDASATHSLGYSDPLVIHVTA